MKKLEDPEEIKAEIARRFDSGESMITIIQALAPKEPTPAEVVGDINGDIWLALFEGKHYREQQDSHRFSLTYLTDGNGYEGIMFLDQAIWDNQDNGIPWDDATDAPSVPLRVFVLNQVREFIEKLEPLAAWCAQAAAPVKVVDKDAVVG